MSACFFCNFSVVCVVERATKTLHPDASNRHRQEPPEHTVQVRCGFRRRHPAEPTFPAFLDIRPGTPEPSCHPLWLRKIQGPSDAPTGGRAVPMGMAMWGQGLGWGGPVHLPKGPREGVSASPITPPGRGYQLAWRPALSQRPRPLQTGFQELKDTPSCCQNHRGAHTTLCPGKGLL